MLTIATQNLGSLRAEKTETPAGSRPEERDFLQQAGAWIADDGCSKSRQPRIRKDRNTSRIKARRTRVFTPEGLPPSKRISTQAGAWSANNSCSKPRQPQRRKDRNTSRIKAQNGRKTLRNRRNKKGRNVAYGTL